MDAKKALKIVDVIGYLYSFYCFVTGKIDFGLLLSFISFGLTVLIYLEHKYNSRKVQESGIDPRAKTLYWFSSICSIIYFIAFALACLRQMRYMEGNFQSFIDIGIVPVLYVLLMLCTRFLSNYKRTLEICGNIMGSSFLLSFLEFIVIGQIEFANSIFITVFVAVAMFLVPGVVFFLGSLILEPRK